MKRNGDIVSYSAEELEEMRARGESRSDFSKVRDMTEEELEASILADPDEGTLEMDWSEVYIGMPPEKDNIHIRLDHDIVEWFKNNGKGYQTRINAVLRSFVDAQKKDANGK